MLIIAYLIYFFIWKYLNSKPIETLLDLLIKELIMSATMVHAHFIVAIIIIPNLPQFQHELAVASGLMLIWTRDIFYPYPKLSYRKVRLDSFI